MTQIKFFLIALWINRATTLLSTPPDKAQITLSFLTVFFISLINFIFWEFIFHFFFILQIVNKKFLNICLPLFVCVTSGWNWTPYILSFEFSIIVYFDSFVDAITLKYLGILTTASSWLIHTALDDSKKFLVNNDFFFSNKKARPNSLVFLEGLILPPNNFVISCKP